MDIPLIAARAVNFAGAISLAGIFGFVAFVMPRPAERVAKVLRRLGWISLAMILVSGPFRLLLVAETMTGYSLHEAIVHAAPREVLAATQFGHAALVRFVLLLAAVPCVAVIGRRRSLDVIGSVLAASGLAAMAWQGHAGADVGWDGVLHLSADAAHLIAAGLWLGALLPLAYALRLQAEARAEAVNRFSSLGVACVAVLLVSGIVNAWYLVGSTPALLGTAYGQTLLVKLMLVAAMLGFAAVNRFRLVPRLAEAGSETAAARLARHAVIEGGLGLGVIIVVAALGTMIPAAHEAIVWPFGYRIDLGVLTEPALRVQVGAAAALAALGLALALIGIWRHRGWAVIVGLALMLGFGWRPLELLAVAATPTSYVESPEPFAVPSLATGGAIYRQQCVACHGEDGEGDGPLATELPIVPPDLASPDIVTRPEGDLFWSLTMGAGEMPSFAALAVKQRWDLVVYLLAQREVRASRSTLIAEVTASPAPRAPDFVLQTAEQGAATLADLRKQGGVLLIFATLPDSQARLDQLTAWRESLRQAGVAVVTIVDAPQIRGVYALYERPPRVEEAAPVTHVEFLVDRNGYIRARWRPGDTPDWTQSPVLQREIATMTRIKLAPVAPSAHVHEG
jgi:putative copper export protein/mono/diheme cytochrome c family protein